MALMYAENFTAIRNPVPRRGRMGLLPGQSQTGYGKKIATDIMVKFPNSPRFYRVYHCIFSNNGTSYVIRKKQTIYFRSTAFDGI